MENREPGGTPSSTGLDANIAAALSYITIIGGIIFYVLEKQSRFVKFSAMQSILLNVAMIVLLIVIAILQVIIGFIPRIGGTISCIFSLLDFVVWIGGFILWLIAIIKAFQGQIYKMPVIGDYAERYTTMP